MGPGMLFNSTAFVALVAATFAFYYVRPLRAVQVPILIAASLAFYAYGQPWLLILLLCSATITSLASFAVAHGTRPRLWAVIGVVANLSVLAFFKYNHLIAESIAADLDKIDGLGATLLMLPLPVGISFYTFQGISLVIDTLRGVGLPPKPTGLARHLRDTIFYIIFFPQLVAGPIVKAHDFLPQIGPKRLADVDWDAVIHNLVLGYFLKMVIADNLAQLTSFIKYPIFLSLSSKDLLLLLVAYSAQIFADFAGYSAIAIGVAAMFGYKLPINFNRPYIATSIADFWRRWHISLSSFLREYLYFPLGGNRKGRVRTYLNLLVVMGLGGLWHGTSWSYAVWGLWHGAGLALERALVPEPWLNDERSFRVLRMLAVFAFVTLGWLLFKLPDIKQVFAYLAAIARNWSLPSNGVRSSAIMAYCLPVAIYHAFPFLPPLTLEQRRSVSGVLLALTVVNSGSADAFIYFQF